MPLTIAEIDEKAAFFGRTFGYTFRDRYEEAFKFYQLPFEYAEWKTWGTIRQQGMLNLAFDINS